MTEWDKAMQLMLEDEQMKAGRDGTLLAREMRRDAALARELGLEADEPAPRTEDRP